MRQSQRASQIIYIRHGAHGEFPFENLALPLILKNKDNTILEYVSNLKGFYFNYEDFQSFINITLLDRWHTGLKTFLWSTSG
jgi:hypothetical protein